MAQLTIDIPDQHIPRILAAFAVANAAQAKARVIDYIKSTVIEYENDVLRQQQIAQITQDLNNVPIT